MKGKFLIMGSMEEQLTADYSFVGDNTISLILPDTFNSGFYLINGVRLFRYINDTTYDEAYTEMNIPNSEGSIVNGTVQANGLVKHDDSFDPFAYEGASLDNEKEHRAEAGTESTGEPLLEEGNVDPSDFCNIVSKFIITSPRKLSIFITFEDKRRKSSKMHSNISLQ